MQTITICSNFLFLCYTLGMQKINKELKIVYFVATIASILYISLIFNNNLWMDEAFSSVLVNTDFSNMMQKSAADTLPPLYNILNWCMIHLFGFNSVVLRFCSIIPMICVLFMSVNTIYKRFGFLTALIFTICIGGMPSMYYYGTEIRMYALAMAFVTLCGIYGIECFYTPDFKNFFCLALFTLGAAYTHHFAFVSCGGVFFFLLIALFVKKRMYLKHFFISLLFIGLLYLPNLFNTLRQMGRVNGYFSMPEFSPSLIASCLKTPFTTTFTPFSAILIAVFVIVPILLLYQTKSLKPLLPGLLCIFVFVFTLTFGATVTLLFKANIFIPRYLFPSYGLLWLGFSIFAGQLEYSPKCIKYLLPGFLVLVCVITYHSQFVEEYRPGVNEMTEFFNENIDLQNDCYIIYEDNYQIEICFRYYFPEFKKTSWDDSSECSGNLWYLQVPGFEDKAGTIESNGYNKEYAGSFNFDRYTFDLYRLSR